MHNFEFYSPTKIVFGKDSEKRAGEMAAALNAKKVLVVYGSNRVEKSGLLKTVTDSLENEGIEVRTAHGIKANPTYAKAVEIIEQNREFQPDLLLAVGGGSVIDTAKAAAIALANPDHELWEIWMGKAKVSRSIPVGSVLTIPAAGSETSDSAVLTREDLELKKGLSTDLNRPVFALMNPALALSLPKYQRACGITDIMMHTLERYVTPLQGNEMTDSIAEGLLRTVISNGPKIMTDDPDLDAMSEIMWAGSLSHNNLTGLGGVKDFSVHQMGHELSAKTDIAHGASLSCVWDSYARYVYSANPARFARYARNVWGIREEDDEKAALQGIEKTRDFFASLGMPVCFSQAPEIGVQTSEGLEAFALGCTYGNTRTIGQFKKLNAEDVKNIYTMANH